MTDIVLEHAEYIMELGGGGDIWKLNGKVFGHPNFEDGTPVAVSTPVEFDETTNIMKTLSGRTYLIGSYGDRDKVVKQIQEDIANRGYERH